MKWIFRLLAAAVILGGAFYAYAWWYAGTLSPKKRLR